MEKINFINQSTPALNATNLNKLQDNVEDAIDEVQSDTNTKLSTDNVKTTQTSSNTDTYSCNYVNEIERNLKGTVLWENNSPASSFTLQNILLSESLLNYDYYSIIYKNKNSEDLYYDTGKIPVGHGCRLIELYGSSVSYGVAVRERQVTYSNATTLSVGSGKFASAGSSASQDDNVCIPVYVIGY